MKVKIGDTIYDSEKEPIMVILTDNDKRNISRMPLENSKYCSYPNSSDTTEVMEWMSDINGD